MVSRQEIVHKGRAVLSAYGPSVIVKSSQAFVCPLFEALVSSVQLQQCWRDAGVCTTHTSLNHEWWLARSDHPVDCRYGVTLYIVDMWSPCRLDLLGAARV